MGVVLTGVPRYNEVIEKGVGAFLRDPAKADKKSLFFE
jgi:hypothetical protein